jgi:hypothetical protein
MIFKKVIKANRLIEKVHFFLKISIGDHFPAAFVGFILTKVIFQAKLALP